MKPRIFIGSSSEALEVAKYVKDYLNKYFECFLWTDDIFKFNEGFLETLMKEASLFDFGILIFSKDDYQVSRNSHFDSPRDNVLFEYGLFLGRLGIDRAYVLKEAGVKIPSDLLGITLAEYVKAENLSESEKLNSELEKIILTVKEKMQLGVLGLLPSTALAIGYFYNFASCVCDYLATIQELEFNGRRFTKFKFKIIIPKNLDSDIKKRANKYFKKNKHVQFSLASPNRNYPLFITAQEIEDEVLILSDMPTTLSGIDKAIEMYIRKGHIGKSSEQKLLEEREMRNFQAVLEKLIENDSYCKEYIELVLEE